ncbi:MAG: peptidylprolyl isomerase [Myxococcales bacterium]|nr:peptidylprolyl isomerase [Myxococcales bacterium]
MEAFRNKGVMNVVYGAIILATGFVFVVGFNPSAGKKMGSWREACVATVRGHCVDPKAHRAAYKLMIPRGRSGELLTAQAKKMGLSKIALDGLIERELLIAEAERLGLTVSEKSPDEVSDSIYAGYILLSVPSEDPSMPMSLGLAGPGRPWEGRIYAGFKDPKTKQFDLKTYERNVRVYTGRSATEFREWQAREILAAKMRDLVRAPVRVSEEEALDRYLHEKSTASLEHMLIRRSWIEKFVVSAPDKDVDAWAKDKTNLKQIKVTIRHVLIRAQGEADTAARTKALAVLERLNKGEDIKAVAKEVSDDKGSGANGGDVGTDTSGFVHEFRDAANELSPGEMTKTLVKTQFGYHIIKKDDAKHDDAVTAFKQAKSLELAKGMATKALADLKAGKSGDEIAKELIAPWVKPAPAAPAPTADADGGAAAADGGAPPEPPPTADTSSERPQFQTTNAFNRGGDPIPDLSTEVGAKVVKFAFDAKAGDIIPEALRTDDGFLILRVKEQKAATKEEFDKERDVYTQMLLAAKQNEALVLYVKRLREAAKADVKVDQTYLLDAKGDAGAPQDDEE